MIKRVWLFLAMTLALVVSSCEKEEGVTEYDRVSREFTEHIGGDVDPIQFWRAAVTLKVNVQCSEEVKIWAVSVGQTEILLYDMAISEGMTPVLLAIPQGYGNKIELIAVTNTQRTVCPVTLTGEQEQTVDISIASARETITRSASNQILYGSSVLHNEYYSEISLSSWKEVMELISTESVDQSTRGEIVNYELISNGKFEVTFIAGFGNSFDPHMLGYYFHSPGTYIDVKFVDIAETHVYDYLDGMAKSQYQICEPFQAYNALLLPNVWYDSNYDMQDDPLGLKTPNVPRRNDDAYNAILVWQRMGDIVSKIQGLTFVIDVPVGMHLGFYLRMDNDKSPEQFVKVTKLGMPAYAFPSEFTAYNFSAQAFNYSSTGKKTHRSWIHEFEDYIFMGMEDIFNGGDLDCNDVVFGMTATDMQMVMPDVTVPDIDYMLTKDVTLPWTLSFEDTYRKADFDYNDAVIRLEPDFDNEKIKVTVLAAGTDDRVWLHYDGPNGDINLGEIHQILDESIEEGTPEMPFINTKSSRMSIPGVDLDLLPWPKTYNMYDDARRFYIEVQRGTCATCSDSIRLPIEPGLMPEVLLVPGEWRWPKEGNHIVSVYSNFPDWCADVMNTNFWNWHLDPKPNSYVNIR